MNPDQFHCRGRDRYVAVPMNAKDTMDGIYEKGECFKKNKINKEMNTILTRQFRFPGLHKEKRQPGEFNTHSILKAE